MRPGRSRPGADTRRPLNQFSGTGQYSVTTKLEIHRRLRSFASAAVEDSAKPARISITTATRIPGRVENGLPASLRSGLLSGHDLEHLALPVHALEVVHAAVLEDDPRARDEVAHRARDEDLVGRGESGDAGPDAERDPGEVLAVALDLPGVEPRAHGEAEAPQPAADRRGAADPAARALEGRQEAVAGRVDLVAAEALELVAHEAMVGVEQVPPAAVAQLGGALRR